MVALYVTGGILALLVFGWGARKFVRWLSSGDVAKAELKHAQTKEEEDTLAKAISEEADADLARALDDFGVRPPFPRKPNGTP